MPLNSSGIGGARVVITPDTITLKKCSNTETMAAGNILMGGPIGLGIDAASVAMNKYNADNQIAMAANLNCKPKA